MSIESLQGTNVAYQGNSSQVYTKQVTASAETTVRQNVQDTVNLLTKNGDNQEASNQDNVENSKQQEQVKKAVEGINKNAKNTEAIFGIHEGTNRVTIKIIDKDSKKVIKEFPPEKTLDMIEKIWEMAGLMVDEKR